MSTHLTDGDELSADAIYLAVDQGGHATRAAAIDGRGRILTLQTQAINTRHRGEDLIEHDPEEMVESLRFVIQGVVAELGADAALLAGAGLATQRSNVACWDRDSGRALSPIISWQDRRGRHWLEGLAQSAPRVRELTGLMLSPHYGASKLRWCLDELPQVRDALNEQRLAWGPMASFLVHRLLEEHPLAADPINAARTLLWNPAAGDWDPELLELFGLPRRPLPPCVTNRYPYGHVVAHGHRIPFTVLTGDQSAALFSLGLPDFDAVYINMGTGVFLQQCGERLVRYGALLHSVVWRDDATAIYALEGTVNGGASALHHEARRLDVTDIESRLPQWLDQCLDPPLFLNGIGGLGSPYWAAGFASRYVGEGDAASRLAAVAESIVFLIQRNLEAFAAARRPRKIIISGGLAAVDGLCRRVAALTRLPVYRAANVEASLCGLGYLLAGFPGDYARPAWQHVFEPRADTPLSRRYQRWRDAMDGAVAQV
jgi:glycerol kinase